jgi:hypothetical protein
MKIKYRRRDLPVAFTMLDAVRRIKDRRDGRHAFDRYFLYWIAFKNIYGAVASEQGINRQLRRDVAGEILTRKNGSVRVPLVEAVEEASLVDLAVDRLPDPVKDELILHASTRYFVDRIPFWDGQPVETDAFGQQVRGVVEVTGTVSRDYPVWSPIDSPALARYLVEPAVEDRALLARQIGGLLFTVSKNLVSFSRKFDDSTDLAVAEHALPLLERIVSAYLNG